MRLVGAFFDFAMRVLDAARRGGLPGKDIKKLDHLLTRTGRRNMILAKGILSALDAGGAAKKDTDRFADMLGKANHRIMDEQEPFTAPEKKELADMFARAYISRKTERWFSSQLDELLAEEMHEYLTGKRRVEVPVPSRKTVRFEDKKKKERPGTPVKA